MKISLRAMMECEKWSLTALRVGMGWLFVYAGISKILDPAWTAAGYLNNAKTFPALFEWLASPQNIGWINILNEWGLFLVGISLILGAGTRIAAVAGGALMIIYYLPILQFPYAGDHSYLVDDHIIYLLVFAVLYTFDAGRYWGMDSFLVKWAKHRGLKK